MHGPPRRSCSFQTLQTADSSQTNKRAGIISDERHRGGGGDRACDRAGRGCEGSSCTRCRRERPHRSLRPHRRGGAPSCCLSTSAEQGGRTRRPAQRGDAAVRSAGDLDRGKVALWCEDQDAWPTPASASPSSPSLPSTSGPALAHALARAFVLSAPPTLFHRRFAYLSLTSPFAPPRLCTKPLC